MPASVIALPLDAIARREDSEACAATSCNINDWLESLKQGWGVRFTPAFHRLGLTDLRKLARLQGTDRDALEEELRTQGARIVQLKQIRNAINALANADKTPQPAATPKRKDFESPMAIYFGDSYPNLFNHFSEQFPSKSNSPSKCCGITDAFPCKSPKSTHAGEELCVTVIDSPPGLPYKSPMAAFFDGDNIDDFYLSPRKNSDSDSSVSAHPTEVVQMSPMKRVDDQAAKPKSALQRAANRKASRVTWADDLAKKAALPLVELIDAPTLKEPSFAQSVWRLSQDPEGTFEVQRAIEDCSDIERLSLASELRGHVYEATQCPHANHVLRKVITTMPSSALNFIVLELLSVGQAGIFEIARHRYGCRIIEGLLTHFDIDQIGCLVKCLLANALSLCTHMYGNFVIQRILETPSLHGMDLLRETVHSNLKVLGTNFYGCAVVGKMLRHSDDGERLRLARAIISVNGLLAAMGRHRLGKETIELVMAKMHGPDRIAAQAQLTAPLLKMSKRGRTH